jgi:hypothetical protein
MGKACIARGHRPVAGSQLDEISGFDESGRSDL